LRDVDRIGRDLADAGLADAVQLAGAAGDDDVVGDCVGIGILLRLRRKGEQQAQRRQAGKPVSHR
jgi:hypothetical protein